MLMGIAAYAERRGCSVSSVQHAIGTGRITLDAENLIDADVADQQWEDTLLKVEKQAPKLVLRQESAGSPDEPPMNYTHWRAQREKLEVERRKLELAVRRGELISRAEMEASADKTYRQYTAACMNIAPRLAPLLVGQMDEGAIFDLIDREVRLALQTFTEDTEGKAA